MASFETKLQSLLNTATEQGVITVSAKEAILSLARLQGRKGGLLSLASVLGGLGGFAVFTGVILLISSNWQYFSDWTKIIGFVLMLAGVHSLALIMRIRGSDKTKTIESLHFLGAGLFLAGIGLIAQIFHISSNSGSAFALWFTAILPLALLLRSASITFMSLIAFLFFVHINGVYSASPFYMGVHFTSHLMLEMALAVGLISFAVFAREEEHSMMRYLLVPGVIILFLTLYGVGFYHEYDGYFDNGKGSYVYPTIAVLFALGGIVYGLLDTEKEKYFQLLAALGGVLGLVVVILFIFIDKPSKEMAWGIAIASWILWFWLAFLCVSHGAFEQRKGLVNLGVAAIGLGIMTRFFDLIGTMLGTGTVFILGGAVLLLLGWALEKWRRSLIAHWERKDHAV